MTKFCRKCKIETERNNAGDCKPCACVRGKAWRNKNAAKIKTYNAMWYESNLDLARSYSKVTYASNSEKAKLAAAKLFRLQRGKCPCCSKPLGNNYHLDHIMPIALGGCK